MKLSDKGPNAPPPVLSKHLQYASDRIQLWPNVIAATHWDLYSPSKVDGADFYLGDDEVGHIHLHGEVHIPLTAHDHGFAIAAGLARPFQYGAFGSGTYRFWIEADVRNAAEADIAVTLFEMSYRRSIGSLNTSPQMSALKKKAAGNGGQPPSTSMNRGRPQETNQSAVTKADFALT